MISPPKFKKVLSTAHLTLITLSSLFALIIFVISLFTFATLTLGLDTASAAVTILFHLVIIILSWRRSLNSQVASTPASKSSFSSPTTSPVLALPATGAALTIIVFLLPLWLIAFAAQILDVLDPKSPNKTQANQSIQLATPGGRILGTDDDDQGFGQMLSLALVVCEAVEIVVILGIIVYGVSVRRKWRMEKEKAGIKSFMLSPGARDFEKGYSSDRQRPEPALELPSASTSPIAAIKRITQHFTTKPRDLRKAPFPVRGPPNPAPAPSAPLASTPVSAAPVESLPTASPKVLGTVPASRASQASQESRFSRLASAVGTIKGLKRPGRAWSYLTPGRPSMMFGETPIETAVDNGGRPSPFGSRRVTGQSGHLRPGHAQGADAASAVDSLYALYEDEKDAQDVQPLPIPVPGKKLPNYIHRQPTGPRTRMTGTGEQVKETFGGVVKVKAPRPPKKAHAQIGRIPE